MDSWMQIPQKIVALDNTQIVLFELQEKMKSDKEKLSREALNFID